MADDQEMCLICYEDIFQKPIAALCCGHVYHRECITGWLRASKLPGDQGECPQCKQRTAVDEMRLLEYDTVAPLQSSVRRSSARHLERSVLPLGSALEEELAVLREERQERQCRCAEMRAHLDIQNQKHGKLKLPVLARQEQEALEEERRKLRQVGPHERSQLLHSALVSALRQEADAQRLSLDRQKAAEEAELMMSRLRQEVEKLRQQVEVMQAVERTCQRMDDRSEARQVSKVKGTSLAEFKRQLSRSGVVGHRATATCLFRASRPVLGSPTGMSGHLPRQRVSILLLVWTNGRWQRQVAPSGPRLRQGHAAGTFRQRNANAHGWGAAHGSIASGTEKQQLEGTLWKAHSKRQAKAEFVARGTVGRAVSFSVMSSLGAKKPGIRQFRSGDPMDEKDGRGRRRRRPGRRGRDGLNDLCLRPSAERRSRLEESNRTWECLRHAIHQIHQHNASSLSFEELYRNAYNLVLHKYGELLYNGVQGVVAEHLKVVAQSCIECPDDRLLDELKKQWDDHKTTMVMIRDILMYMDRNFVTQYKKVPVYEMGLMIFRDKERMKTHLLTLLLDNISAERRGEQVDRILLKHTTNMLVELGVQGKNVYRECFEDQFLDATRKFYQDESKQYISQNPCSDYLRKAEKRIREEKARVENYLHESTMEKIQELCDEEWISVHYKTLIHMENSGCAWMFQCDKIPDLERTDFQLALKQAFESFLNKDTRTAQYLSLYVDDQFRKGLKGMSSDADVDVALEQVVTVFRFLQDKDVFENFYKQHLSRRLLTGRSVSDEAERSMISKLKSECGHQYTSKLEGMFQDMKLSEDIMKQCDVSWKGPAATPS
eukprot:g7931.t1